MQVEVLALPSKERKAYVDFEKGLQNEYVKVRHRLRTQKGSHTMEVLTLLSKFRQVRCLTGRLLRCHKKERSNRERPRAIFRCRW